MVKTRCSKKIKSVKYGTITIHCAPKIGHIYPEAVNKVSLRII